jgi:molecular chaperone DnaK
VAADYLQRSPGLPRPSSPSPPTSTTASARPPRKQGRSIGLEIVKRIINEPTAAALAYGMDKHGKGNRKIAVYDLGGGTFDISIIEIRGRTFEVKATGGDIFLGGIDWDNALIGYVLEDFQAKNGIDLRADPIAMQRIKDLAERTKIDLSSRTEAPFSIPFVTMTPEGMPLDVNLFVTREKYEELTDALVKRTIEIADMVVQDAGMRVDQLDEILLVGGQTRWPAVQQAVTAYFGKAPSKGVHPDEAVAVGAALYAHSLETDVVDQRVQLLDVIPMRIGIEDAAGNMHEIFSRNAPVPNQKSVMFTTSFDDQAELEMRIYQGEDAGAKKNEMLGKFTFKGIRTGPRGSVKVDVVFDCNSEGILTLSATDRDTGVVMKEQVKVLSREK